MITISCVGQLEKNTPAGRLRPAELRSAPLQAAEMDVPLSFPCDDDTPVIYSYSETFDFLAQVTLLCRDQCSPAHLLVKQQMPTLAPLPEAMLETDVVLLHDLSRESEFLESAGIDHVRIEVEFKKYGWDIVENRVEIAYVSRGEDPDILAPVVTFCREWGLEMSISVTGTHKDSTAC